MTAIIGGRRRPVAFACPIPLAALLAVLFAAPVAAPLAAQQAPAGQDSAFAALQARGREAMGVNQYTSRHRFEPLPDGGRIVLVRDSADTVGVATIRRHMREIAAAFAAGRFDIPAFVHARGVPGTDTMAVRRAAIRYEARDVAGGGEVRVTTTDPAALRAVHEFLAFQRSDHRTAGHGAHR